MQLGPTNESHVIRTIEYWDIERKRYPQYDHCAVIIAEEITSRFLNVISLFNGTIPLIAIKMSALRVGQHTTLVFTTVLDELHLGLVDEDEETQATTDRAYWEQRGSKETVSLADDILEIIHQFDPSVELKYNKVYIGLATNGRANNVVVFVPKKTELNVQPRLDESAELNQDLQAAGLDLMPYDKPWNRYRIRIDKDGLNRHRESIDPRA